MSVNHVILCIGHLGFLHFLINFFFLIDLFSNSRIFYFDVFNLMLIPINDFFYFKYYIFHV